MSTKKINGTDWLKEALASPEAQATHLKLDFAVAMEHRLIELGWTKAQLANKLSISPAAVTLALRGDGNLTIDRMAKIADTVGYELQIGFKPKTELSINPDSISKHIKAIIKESKAQQIAKNLSPRSLSS